MDNAQIVVDAIEAMNRGDLEGWLSPFADEVYIWWTGMPRPYTTKAEFRDEWENMFRAYPGCQLIISNVIAQGDFVVVECEFSATHTGPLKAQSGEIVQPTGNHVGGPGIDVYEVKNGRITVQRGYFDTQRLDKQLAD